MRKWAVNDTSQNTYVTISKVHHAQANPATSANFGLCDGLVSYQPSKGMDNNVSSCSEQHGTSAAQNREGRAVPNTGTALSTSTCLWQPASPIPPASLQTIFSAFGRKPLELLAHDSSLALCCARRSFPSHQPGAHHTRQASTNKHMHPHTRNSNAFCTHQIFIRCMPESQHVLDNPAPQTQRL